MKRIWKGSVGELEGMEGEMGHQMDKATSLIRNIHNPKNKIIFVVIFDNLKERESLHTQTFRGSIVLKHYNSRLKPCLAESTAVASTTHVTVKT